MNPPTTNKGGNTLTSIPENDGIPAVPQTSVDWLQFTVTWNDDEPVYEALARALPPFSEFDTTAEHISPVRGYTDGLQLQTGKAYWHRTLRSQRVLIVLSGQDMEKTRRANISDVTILDWVIMRDHRVTRIDLALDLHNWGAKPHDLIDWSNDHKLETPAHHIASFMSTELVPADRRKSETVYVGSSSSDRQLRCYDKAAERGVPGDWIRLEMVLRADRARVFVASITHRNLEASILAIMRDFVLVRGTWLSRATEGIAVEMLPIPRKAGNREKWLLTQVLKALENELEMESKEGRATVYDAFTDLLAKFY